MKPPQRILFDLEKNCVYIDVLLVFIVSVGHNVIYSLSLVSLPTCLLLVSRWVSCQVKGRSEMAQKYFVYAKGFYTQPGTHVCRLY